MSDDTWEERPLALLLASMETGSRPKGGVRGIAEGIPSLGGEHLNPLGAFNISNVRFVPESFYVSMRRGHIQRGDVLVVKDGATTGKVSFVGEDFPFERAVANEHLFVCRPRSVDGEYLFWYLFSDDGQRRILEHFKGSAQGGITRDFADGTYVPVAPTRAQQEQVAHLLRQAFARRLSAERNLSTARQAIERFRQAILAAACSGRLIEGSLASFDFDSYESELPSRRSKLPARLREPVRLDPALELGQIPDSWRWMTLDQLTIEPIQNGLYLPASRYGSGVPIVRIDDFQVGSSRSREDLKRVSANESEQRRFALLEGDIVINRVNSPSHLGKNLHVGPRHVPSVFESNMMRFRVAPPMSARYVSFYLSSVQGRQLLTRNAKWAVNQASINQLDVRSCPVPVPPPEEQIKTALFVERLLLATDSLTKRIDSALRAVDRSSQAVFSKAFRGQLAENNHQG